MFNPSITDCVAETTTRFATVRLLGIGGVTTPHQDVLTTRLTMRNDLVKQFHFRVFNVNQDEVDAADPKTVREVLMAAMLEVMQAPQTHSRFGRLTIHTKGGEGQLRSRLYKLVVPEVESLLG